MTSTPEYAIHGDGPDGRPILGVPTAAVWEARLDDEHESSPGAWLRLTKKGSGDRGPTYEEALEVALSFGWIDGQSRSYDLTRAADARSDSRQSWGCRGGTMGA